MEQGQSWVEMLMLQKQTVFLALLIIFCLLIHSYIFNNLLYLIYWICIYIYIYIYIYVCVCVYILHQNISDFFIQM